MKKTIIAVVLVILGAILSIPLANGMLMERTIRRAFANLNRIHAASGTGYAVEILRYDRGYLTSDIVWKVDLGILKRIYPIEAIEFQDHARHGFAGVVSTTSLERNAWYADVVAERLQGRDPLHITTEYGLSGRIESTVVLDAFPIRVEGETIDVKAGRMTMATDRRLTDFTSSGHWSGFSAGDVLAIGDISMDSELTMLSPYLWAGGVRYGVQRVNVSEKKTRFELVDLKGAYTLSVNDAQSAASIDARFSVDGMETTNARIDSAAVRFVVNGLDTDGYQEFMEMYTRNMSRIIGGMATLEGGTTVSAEAVKKQMAMIGFQMMAAYEKLLKKGLEFRIADLHLNLADGEINGAMTLKLLEDMTFMQFAPILSQPERLFDIFYLKSDLSLPAVLVADDPRWLIPAFPGMQTGVFVKQGANLVHQAETVDGKLMLNRKAVILPGQSGAGPAAGHGNAAASGRL